MATPRNKKPTHLRESLFDALAGIDDSLAVRFVEQFPQVAGETRTEEMRRLNRYWRHELARLDADTLDARSHLDDKADPSDWLKLYRLGIEPFVAQYRLPHEEA